MSSASCYSFLHLGIAVTTVVGKASGTIKGSMICQVMFHSVGKITLVKSIIRVENFAETPVIKL